ncbi:MAG: hypothetical protein KGQ38_01690 [Actinomycetales bacterium]|nr:hypothetical protein [Actinomycetales bacterium]
MRNSRYRYSRLVMIIGAITFGINAIWLLLSPDGFAQYIGLESGPTNEWAFRMLGVVLVALSVHQSATSRQVPDKMFKRAALVMIAVSLGLAYLTYVAPGELDTGRWIFVGIGSLFALLYAVTLPIKSIGILEEESN